MFKRILMLLSRLFKKHKKPSRIPHKKPVKTEVPISSTLPETKPAPHHDELPSFPSLSGKKFIDISHWVDIDFTKLEFDDVIMKATEGQSYIDSKLYSNVKGCQENAKRFGFYHYYKIDSNPHTQAKHFIDTVGLRLFKSCYHLPVIDLELGGNHSEKDIKSSLMDVKMFAEYINSFTGRKCRIYSNDALMRYLAEEFKRLGFDELCANPWVARYPTTPKYFSPWPKLWAHQFSETAIVKGSHDEVDLNTFK